MPRLKVMVGATSSEGYLVRQCGHHSWCCNSKWTWLEHKNRICRS